MFRVVLMQAAAQSFRKPRARPKSQIFKSQFLFTRMFEGLRSRCNTLAEWRYLRIHRTMNESADVKLAERVQSGAVPWK